MNQWNTRYGAAAFVCSSSTCGALGSSNVTSTNVAAVGLLSATQSAMMQQGMSAVAAQTIGIAALMKQVATLATVQSFNDCFYLATLVSLCGLVPCIWLKRG